MRLVAQAAFALTCVLVGWQFAEFVGAARVGETPLPARPPGVEGFLPISGLMGAFDWAHQGALNTIHPAATVLLLIFVAMSLLLRKSFCSWICPVGLLSESIARLGRRAFGRNFRLWGWLDFSLRGLKYLLLAFFLWAIVSMGSVGLRMFIESPYNRVADVKMLLFFAHLGTISLVVIGVLALASAFVTGVWCRYLCPYGALLGLFSWLSPVKVRRDAGACIDCGLCDKACVARLPVSDKTRIASAECTGCLDCVASCPVRGALEVGTRRRRVGVLGFAAAVLAVFFTGYWGARLTGRWHNSITDHEYVVRISQIDLPAYAHPGAVALR